MPKILQRKRLVPNVHLIEIEAPEIAKKCKPGQFVIIMPDEFGERIPLTIGDWDQEQGSVTVVVMVVGSLSVHPPINCLSLRKGMMFRCLWAHWGKFPRLRSLEQSSVLEAVLEFRPSTLLPGL